MCKPFLDVFVDAKGIVTDLSLACEGKCPGDKVCKKKVNTVKDGSKISSSERCYCGDEAIDPYIHVIHVSEKEGRNGSWTSMAGAQVGDGKPARLLVATPNGDVEVDPQGPHLETGFKVKLKGGGNLGPGKHKATVAP